ncbi:MAG: polyphosphate kinase 1 [Phycisphaerales bacterium]
MNTDHTVNTSMNGELATSGTGGGGGTVGDMYLNRETQWLEFNSRVLQLAADPARPLLERVRFLSIFSSNLDEFFMKRVGGLHRQAAAGVPVVGYENVAPDVLLAQIRERVIPMANEQSRIYRKEVRPGLMEHGIELISYSKLNDKERAEVREWFDDQVFPILTPLAVDLGHRFPFISNLSVSLGVMLKRPGDSENLFARVKVPEVVKQWFQLQGTTRFVLLRDIIEHNLGELFSGMEILNVLPFRVTRNADVDAGDEDTDDLLEQIEAQLRQRRFARVVRLQVGRKAPQQLLDLLCEELRVTQDDIYTSRGLFNYRTLDEIADLNISGLHDAPWTPVIPVRLRDRERSMFSIIRDDDLLVHHPYESFEHSVERFIEEASNDPKVLCIKQSLYRTSGDSPFVHSLIHAAESGKQVAVLVELRARFDEARNIAWARKLEEAGVHVAYGVVGLKTHCKLALVVRQETDGMRCYAHFGTGNYHSRTARLYEDVGLFTTDLDICEDAIDLFNVLTGRSQQQEYKKLLVAPHAMKNRFLKLIEREAELHQKHGNGRIIAKMNQLQDREVIDALYRASQAGVNIDLIVRGFCTLRPGVPGLSENIRIMSILGRFLEHSRIFWFGKGNSDPLKGDFIISSADWMYRNLHNRVEAACPIQHPTQRERLWEILQVCLSDHTQAWDMQPDGSHTLRTSREEGDSGTHHQLMLRTVERTRAQLATMAESRGRTGSATSYGALFLADDDED